MAGWAGLVPFSLSPTDARYCRDRHNRNIQRMADLLLRARPYVSSRMVAKQYLSKRAEEALQEHKV